MNRALTHPSKRNRKERHLAHLKTIVIVLFFTTSLSLIVWFSLYLTARDTLPLETITIRVNMSHIPDGFQDVARRRHDENERVYSSYVIEGESMTQQRHILKGEGYINLREVRSLSQPALSWGFFSFDAAELKHALLKVDWVKSVKIKKIFPNHLSIELTEQQARAIWNQRQLINTEGNLFTVPAQTMPKNLLQLFGPEHEYHNLFMLSKKIRSMLAPLQLELSMLRMSDRGSYEVTLSNKIKILLGRGNPLEKIKKFVKIYPILHERVAEKNRSASNPPSLKSEVDTQCRGDFCEETLQKDSLSKKGDGYIEYIDLRYPHGFSIKAVAVADKPSMQSINKWQYIDQKVSIETE